LDRDGTINRDVHHLSRVTELRLLPGAAEAIRVFNRLSLFVIVVTNQSAVGRGLLEEETLRDIHKTLMERLRCRDARIDKIYYCPHHPEGTGKYQLKCRCRKPATGLVQRAVRQFQIDTRQSFMIGDTTTDIATGKKTGLTTILVRTGFGGKDGRCAAEPDFTVKNLKDAARLIRGLI